MRMEAGPRPRAMKNPISEFPPPIVSAMEQRMRPGRLSESGFLDNSEHLIDVIDRDLESLANVGITPTQIADSLEAAVAQAFRVKSPFDLWNPGVRIGPWELRGESWRGTQDCPFVNADGVVCHGESYSQWDFSLINIRKRTFLAFPGLAIHLIREHRFFEGNVPHRVDPLVACEVLDVETSERRYVEPEKLSECIVESTWRSGVRFFLKSRRANEHVGLPIRRAHGHLRFAVERLKYHLVHRFQRNWVDDPTFGRLEYYDRSRWHGNWMFPPAGENVAIFLPGDRRGLSPGVRDFFETLPDRFDSILHPSATTRRDLSTLVAAAARRVAVGRPGANPIGGHKSQRATTGMEHALRATRRARRVPLDYRVTRRRLPAGGDRRSEH